MHQRWPWRRSSRTCDARNFELLDIQQWTPNSGRLGAVEIPRTEFLQRLERAVNQSVTFGEQLQGDL